MKKSLQIFALLFCIIISAQAPEKFSYQAVIRNASNALITNATVGVKISILKTSAAGTVVYAESQTPTTNVNGLIAIQIGAGTVISGTIAGINWSNDSYYVKTETDPAGGTNYTIAGTAQLLSVPYALYAKNSGGGGGLILPYAGTSSANNVIPFKITNSSATLNQAGFFENTNATNSAAALSGYNSSTGSFGVGVEGRANSNTNGNLSSAVNGRLLGTGNAGAAVYGSAQNAFGIFGDTVDGIGVYGTSSATGTAGAFRANGTGKALDVYGPVKLFNIGQGLGKVLTSDATGNATWQDNSTPFIHFSSIGGSIQTITNNTAQVINSWTGLEETGGANYNATTGEYTIPLTGYYSIIAQIGFVGVNTVNGSQARLGIQIDGNSAKNAYSNSAVAGEYYNDLSVRLEKKLNVGQIIKINARQAGSPTNDLCNSCSTFSINLLHK